MIPYRIYTLTPADQKFFPLIADALHKQQKELFGNMLPIPIPDYNGRIFADTYISAPDTCCIIALNQKDEIIGNIALRPYNYRFVLNNLHGEHIAEVIKLYVRPDYRRQALGARLFAHLKNHAQNIGISHLYLHTHPALNGAIAFWEKQGFKHLGKEESDIWCGEWQIVHMSLAVNT
ncbi:GNAT family N-acetyltransferase [Conchiformibius steedae]|uniref:GNAT family N-acetyltransferase n=1 Tax=Conchiformibius steedae TaxID=153493 RepID=A0A3P2ABG4_9NEIS|nr:GNAT family N-acetyltransferase [Conchiformibius steedae]RRD91540.1 GNAT family N-acetyltransferase [Conchiformibius steedae]